MASKNNLSVLPWYDSPSKQNAKKWWIYNKVYPLFTPAGYMLPFQIMRRHRSGTTISSFKVYTDKGMLVGDYTTAIKNAGITIVPFQSLDYDVIVFDGLTQIFPSMDNGRYYAVLNDSYYTHYSEIFTVVNDISGYLKIEWYDEENFVMDAGTIVYKNPTFKNILYLMADIAKPQYQFEEEVVNRDGFFFPVKQISEKIYRFNFLAPEYLLDAMRFIRLSDRIWIYSEDEAFLVDEFLLTADWEGQGDVANVEVEFQTNTVAKKIPYAGEYVPPTPTKYMSISPAGSIDVGAAATTVNISVDANDSWTLQVSGGATLSATSGTGPANVVLTVPQNTGSASRTFAVTGHLTSEPSIGVSLNVVQAGTSAEYINISITSKNVDGMESQFSLLLNSTGAWTIENNYDWITVEPSSGGQATGESIQITVDTNTQPTVRTGEVKFKLTGTNKEAVLHIMQDSLYILFVRPTSLTFAAAGESKTLDIYNNLGWELVSKPDWITLSAESGDGDEQISVTAAAATEARSGNIVFANGTATATCAVYQAAPAPVGPGLRTLPASSNLSASAQEEIFIVYSDVSFGVESSVSWISLNKSGGSAGQDTVKATVTANTGNTIRTGILTFTATRSGITTTVEVPVTQQGRQVFVPTKLFDSYVEAIAQDDLMQSAFPLTARKFAQLETKGDAQSLTIDAYITGNISPAGMAIDLAVYDLQSGTPQSFEDTTTLYAIHSQVISDLGGGHFRFDSIELPGNTFATDELAIAIRIKVAGTKYYAKLNEAEPTFQETFIYQNI